jgi:hypothetical protein
MLSDRLRVMQTLTLSGAAYGTHAEDGSAHHWHYRYPKVVPVFRELLKGTKEELLFNRSGEPWNLSQFMLSRRVPPRARLRQPE